MILLLQTLLHTSVVQSQQPLQEPRSSEGDPCIEHYSTKSLGYDLTNWDCIRDAEGILWAGNSYGLLEYDGNSWRLLPSINNTPVYAVACGEDDTKYFGLRGAFGRVVYDEKGRPAMDLLSDRLPANAPLLTEIYHIHAAGSSVCFVSEEAVCRWDGKKLSFIPSSRPLGMSFVSNGTLYVNVDSVGLCTLENDRFIPVAGGAVFASDTAMDSQIDLQDKVICLYHDADGQLIVGTRLRGLFRHDGSTFHNIWNFSAITDPLWMPTCAVRLAQGMLAVGTTHRGIWIFDQSGSVKKVFDREAELFGNAVNGLMVDQNQSIWATLDDGITRIDWPGGPVSSFGAERGMYGQITAIRRFAGTLYAATTQGLYYLQASDAPPRKQSAPMDYFVLLPAIRSAIFSLVDAGDALLVSTTNGVYAMDPKRTLRRISSPGRGARALLAVHGSQDTILAGTHSGLYCLIRSGSVWKEYVLSGKKEDFVLSFAEAANGSIWVGTAQHGVRRIDIQHGILNANIRSFDSSPGLASGPIIAATANGQPFFINEDHLLTFDELHGIFQPATHFLKSMRYPIPIDPKFIYTDRNGRVWMQLFEGQTVGYAKAQPNGEQRFITAPFLNIRGDVLAIFTDVSGISWIGADNVVFRYDPAIPPISYSPFKTFIRSVSINGIGGYYGRGGKSEVVSRIEQYDENINFEFASGQITLHDRMLYRWRLDGRDTTWTTASAEHTVHYTNLPAGDYRFRVQAMIPGQFTADEARFAFTILPPWYQTWWFYSLVAVILILAIVVFLAKRRRHSAP
ncbi:MAG: triple tyrosine motif-containing protein [Bacteroidota bacterium]